MIPSEVLFQSFRSLDWMHHLSDSCAILTDENVQSLYGEELRELLLSQGKNTLLFSFPPGESNKTREVKQRIEEAMLASECHRKTTLIALGGGVCTDLGGFLASTYMRGIPLILIPTTLLAMVDAAIGGKNGVNLLHLKNGIGTFYDPKMILIDPSFLETLPEREWRQGLAEIAKHACIADAQLFQELQSTFDRSEPSLTEMIRRNISIKMSVVRKDRREAGYRKILNFGHTVGHALESLSGYRHTHGEAIAMGMLVEGLLSTLLSLLPRSSWEDLRDLLLRYSLFPDLRDFPTAETLYQQMRLDKKGEGGAPSCILLQSVGVAYQKGENFCHPIEDALFRKAWETSCYALLSDHGPLPV